MWKEILNENDIKDFKEKTNCMHDSCIYTINYCSGAYVNETKAMQPFNNSREINIICHSQSEKCSYIELKFIDVDICCIMPKPPKYDAVIYDSSIILDNGSIYWSDYENLDINNMYDAFGTVIKAQKMYWKIGV